MGNHARGLIYYGVPFEENAVFPWDEIGDETIWWLESKGLKVPDSYREQQALLQEHPLPFELINISTCDYPIYALAVVGLKIQTLEEGDAKLLDLEYMLKWQLQNKQNMANFNNFLAFINATMGLEKLEQVGWYLGSYTG